MFPYKSLKEKQNETTDFSLQFQLKISCQKNNKHNNTNMAYNSKCDTRTSIILKLKAKITEDGK